MPLLQLEVVLGRSQTEAIYGRVPIFLFSGLLQAA